MAKFTIIYNDPDTITRILNFMGRSFAYEWNRTDMTHPDFRQQVLSAVGSLESPHILTILEHLSYYNDDLSGMVKELTDYERKVSGCGAGVASRVPP